MCSSDLPVLCHMAEDIWQHLPYPVPERSVFERGWPTVPAEWLDADEQLLTTMEAVISLRARVNRLLESCRQSAGDGLGSSLEAQVHITLGDGDAARSIRATLDMLEASAHPRVDNLADWLLVSALHVGGEAPAAPLASHDEDGLGLHVSRADGSKCERCWHYATDIGDHSDHPSLCGRCVEVLRG